MATTKQTQAARRNVKKAQKAASSSKTIAHMPKATRTALGKQGAAVAARKRSGGAEPKTYEALKDKGMSKERAAKISNAQAAKEKKSKKSG